jgi:hypothetical protein
MARKKRPLKAPKVEEGPPPEGSRPWWRRTDAELLTDRVSEVRSSLGLNKVKLDEKERQELVEEARKRDPTIPNLLDITFCRDPAIGRDGEFLKVPVYKNPRGESVARTLRLKTARRIRMDEYGWAVWDLTDGKRTVEEVGEALKERFGEKVEPLYPRLAQFMAYLVNLGCVREAGRP